MLLAARDYDFVSCGIFIAYLDIPCLGFVSGDIMFLVFCVGKWDTPFYVQINDITLISQITFFSTILE